MLNLALIAALMIPQEAPAQDSRAQDSRPQAQPAAAAAPTPGPTARVLKDLFPAPSGPMTLVVGDTESPLTYQSMLNQYGELTGQHFVVNGDTSNMLNVSLHLDRTMTVPAEEVQSVFERLMRHGDFVLKPLTREGTRLLELVSLQTSARSNLRGSALYLTADELYLAEQHPALLFTAVVTLPNLDVRQVSNSMRTMITDANTQQMLPAGNSNSMVLVGFGDQVSGTIGLLEAMDAAAGSSYKGLHQVFEVARLANADATAVAALLNGAYAVPEGVPRQIDATFAADARTNSILITTRASKLAGIKDLIAALDVETKK